MSLRIGVVFPGQGSQSIGMGVEVAAAVPAAAALFERAHRVLGYDVLELQRSGPDDVLRETRFSQPAIFTTNVALYTAAGAGLQPVVSAGHSFGEFCSLVAAGALAFDDALAIVRERAEAMQEAAQLRRGGMSAVLGLDAAAVRAVIDAENARSGGSVQLANFNAPTQIVISGELQAVAEAGDALVAAGAKRVIPLNVSGAWHSALMEPAVARFARAVAAGSFALPRFDVISNVDARPYRSVETIRENLVRSLAHEVRWHETAEAMLAYGLDAVVEFGAGAVLGPLIKRLAGAPPTLVVSDCSGLEKLRALLAKEE